MRVEIKGAKEIGRKRRRKEEEEEEDGIGVGRWLALVEEVASLLAAEETLLLDLSSYIGRPDGA